MNIHGNLFRDEELTLILLSHALETWQKRLQNPWAQFISSGQLWPHKVSGLSPSYLLDLGEVVLGRNLFRDNGDTMYPHLDSAHRFLGLLSEMTFLTAHSSVPPTPVFSEPGNWQLLASKEDWVFTLGEDWPSLFSPCTGGISIRGVPTLFLMP